MKVPRKARNLLAIVLCVLCIIPLLSLTFNTSNLRRNTLSRHRRTAYSPSVFEDGKVAAPAAAALSYKATTWSQVNPATRTPKLILILARARTGSTFIGQYFNQHPNVFFFFEPLRVVPDFVNAQLIGDVGKISMEVELLANLYSCSFPTYYIFHLGKWPLALFESQALKSLGRKVVKESPERIKTLRYSELCQGYDAIAAKVIRVDRLETLESLVTHFGLDLKIILLTKDPRAYASSWKRFAYFKEREYIKGKTLFDLRLLSTNVTRMQRLPTVNAYCDWLKHNLKIVMRPPDWLKGRVKVVRYEDAALEPYTVLEDLYDFVDMAPHADVYRWLRTNTNAETDASLAGTMTTKRNSSYVAQVWRDDMLFYDVQKIQNVCGQLMKVLGYKNVNRPKSMRDWSIPVLSRPLI